MKDFKDGDYMGYAAFEEKEKDEDKKWLEEWGEGPTDDQLQRIKWRENQRRKEFLEDLSEEERLDFARRQRLSGIAANQYPISASSYYEGRPSTDAVRSTSRRLMRDAELAGMGAAEILMDAPSMIFDRLMQAGQDYEKGFYQRRRRRVDY